MKHLYILGLVALLMPFAAATIQIDAIETDPAIIAAGDTVDVIVRFTVPPVRSERIAAQDWRFALTLQGADHTTEEYIRVIDRDGVGRFETLHAGTTMQRTFRVRIAQDAPAQDYAFELIGRWMQDGVEQEIYSSERFFIDVKRESVSLSVGSLHADPHRIVPGTREAQLTFAIMNAGDKDALNVEVVAHLPEGIRPSFASSSRVFLGVVPARGHQEGTITIDVDTDVASQEHPIRFSVVYRDENQNQYSRTLQTPVFVAEKPRLEFVTQNVTLTQGGSGVLDIIVRNTGLVAAEAIDVRLLKESNQPFVLDTRSGYLGKLYPGEEGSIRIPFSAERTATPAEYNIPLLVRARGDSDRNDNTVYTYRSRATVQVDESTTNQWVFIGLFLVLIVFALLVWRKKK